MLLPNTRLSNTGVLSIRTGAVIARVIEPIINPHNLHIDGVFVRAGFSKEPLILLTKEVRDCLPRGLVVNDEDALSEQNELVRLQPILELDFDLFGMPVYSGNRKLGKVDGYAFEPGSFYIQKIYVTPTLLRGFGTSRHTIDRQQIIEITPRRILIDDSTVKSHAKLKVSEEAPQLSPGYSTSSSTSLTSE